MMIKNPMSKQPIQEEELCSVALIYEFFSLSNPFHKINPGQSHWGDFLVPGSKPWTTNGGFWSLPLKQSVDPKIKIQRQPNSVINGFPPPGVWRWAGVIPCPGQALMKTRPRSITQSSKSGLRRPAGLATGFIHPR